MQPETPAPKPRRNRHLVRWICVGILAILGWYGWKAYDERQARKEAEELGWVFRVDDPISRIRFNWRNAFRRETWHASERRLLIQNHVELAGHFGVIRRLRPTHLLFEITYPYRDLSELKGLLNLTELELEDCPNLVNIDALGQLMGLTWLGIRDAPALSNFDGLKNLQNLRHLKLVGCSGLTNVDALRGLKSLEMLLLASCTKLKNVDGLIGLTKLQGGDIADCPALPREDFERVKAQNPHIFEGVSGL